MVFVFFDKRSIFALIGVPLLLAGCSMDRVSRQQELLHLRVHEFYQRAFSDFESEIEESANLLEGAVQSKTKPINVRKKGLLSSVYVPNFSPRGVVLNQFLEKTNPLETRWDQFLSSHPYVSWLYIFDAASGAMRIAPATPTEITFGKSMDFSKFEFYESAVREYPKVAWQNKTKEDISGTGLILMASRAVKNSPNKVAQVISGDLKVSLISKSVQPLFNEFVSKSRTNGFHFFAYLKPEANIRSPISEYASDQAEWLSIRAFSNRDEEFLRVSPLAQSRLVSIEEKAIRLSEKNASAGHQKTTLVSGRIQLGNAPYHCSVSQLSKPKVLLWICAK